jgi:hypothetical protein
LHSQLGRSERRCQPRGLTFATGTVVMAIVELSFVAFSGASPTPVHPTPISVIPSGASAVFRQLNSAAHLRTRDCERQITQIYSRAFTPFRERMPGRGATIVSGHRVANDGQHRRPAPVSDEG